MLWSFIKWGIPALLVVVVAGSLATRKTFRVETTIPAPPEAVWEILLDTAAYPDRYREFLMATKFVQRPSLTL